MGIIKGIKQGSVADDARRAREEGRQVFVCLFKSGVTHGGMFSGVLGHVGEMVEAVEAEGWRLDKFGYSDGDDKSDRVVGLFRRAEQV